MSGAAKMHRAKKIKLLQNRGNFEKKVSKQ